MMEVVEVPVMDIKLVAFKGAKPAVPERTGVGKSGLPGSSDTATGETIDRQRQWSRRFLSPDYRRCQLGCLKFR